MLSAFKARPINEFKARDKSKIESLLAYGDRIFVGLNNGALRIYRVNESADADVPSENGQTNQDTAAAKVVGLLREDDKFSKKPVQQLAMVKEANILVSLSDSYVSFHDLQDYQLIERLERTKGATCFAVTSNVVKDADTHVPTLVSRLAVAVKRKIICWTWQDTELMSEAGEIGLEATVKSLNWIQGTRLIAGMDPGFVSVDIQSEDAIAINKPTLRSTSDINTGELAGTRFGAVSSSGMGYMGMGSWVPKPMATGMSDGLVLLAKDVNTLFCDTEGKPLEKRQVPWSLAPEAIGYSYPYLLALQPPEKGALQIRNPDTLSLLQTISVPGASILHVPQPNISLAHAGKGFLVASDRVIWRMSALPYDSQLVELVERQRFDEAISMLNLLEDTLIDDKTGRIREIMTQKAMLLFHQQKYRPALDLFTDAETSPDRVIKLYPKSIAGELSSISDETSESEPSGAENSQTKEDEAPKEAPSTPSKGVLARLRGGGGSAKKADSDTASIKSPSRLDSDNISIRTKVAKEPDRPLEGDDLKNAVRCLWPFLAQARVQIQKYLNPDRTLKQDPPNFDNETGKPAFANLMPQSVLQGDLAKVDWQVELLSTARLVYTTLFRSYMLAQPSLAGSLFRIDNFCDPEVVQAALYEGERYNDLIDFLHGKKLHRQALEMLAKFGKGEAEGEIPEGMRGPERTVGYLKQLPPELVDMILEFVRWPIEQEPQVGMQVFLADSDNAEKMPRKRVLDFLASIDASLETQYLEHIIDELGDNDPDFHQQLLDLYIKTLKTQDLDEDEGNNIKERLESFLRKSSTYSQTKTFRQLPADNPIFFEARALVLSAMGNHKQALSIYVFQIQDYDKAEGYCSKLYLAEQADIQACLLDGNTTHEKPFKQVEPEDSSKPNIFAILLGLYLRPPAGEEKRWPQALDLLSRHGARLPASSTLDLMPDDLAVKELQDYFRGRIRNATSILREEMVVRSLESVRRANAERLLMLGPANAPSDKPMGRNRRVRVGDGDHCKVCHKRFTANAVRVYPDNEVIHYGCLGRSGNKAPRESGFSAMRRSAGWE